MRHEESDFVDVEHLRTGMFVELDLGWMAHPFPTGSFKISSQKQIETIRGLGLERVRYVPAKSDPEHEDESVRPSRSPLTEAAAAQRHLELAHAQQLKRQRAELLVAQQRSLVVCEKRFGEATRQYRKTVEQLRTHPKAAAQQCQSLVQGFVGDMLTDGESAIRLLAEAAGDKSSMHPVNVTIVSLLLGKAMGLQESDMVDLGLAAFLHDIGKTNMPDRVQSNEDNLTAAEFKHYQEHVAQSVMLGKDMELSKGALLAIAQHHELTDGSGFPAHVTGDHMSVPARILALVNRYDNLCNPTRSGAALTPHESLALIFAQHKTRFDTVALSAFIRMMGVYPPGSVVQLVDERYAMVVSVNSSRPLRPRVYVYEPGVPREEALILDLEHIPQIGIRRSLKPANLPAAAMDYLAPRQRVCYFFEKVVDAPLYEGHA